MKTVRVGYLSDVDPRDRWAWSGGHHFMFESLRAAGLDVLHVGAALLQGRSRLRRLAGRIGLSGRSEKPQLDEVSEARRMAAALASELGRSRCQVLFAPVASRLVAFADTDLPIVHLSDATFRPLRGYYEKFSALPADVAAAREEIEARALARADLAVFPSAWAADSAVRDYGVDMSAVRVVPLGANLDHFPGRADVEQKGRGPLCRLLFIGRDWKRKGGDVAVETLGALRRAGIDSELVVCGSTPPAGTDPSRVQVFPNLDKRRSRDRRKLHELLSTSHFLVLPTRAECYGMVCCEANAYGLPVLGTDTGGMPIEDGKNGYRMPMEARGADYARIIAATYADDGRYRDLVRSARAVYESRLNWQSWASSMSAELVRLAQHGRSRTRSAAA